MTSKKDAMIGNANAAERCPLTAALDAVGGKWSLVTLYWLGTETRRFAQLQRLMPGISHKVLTETLRDLERNGLVHRRVYAEVPPKVEYAISDHGRSLSALLSAVRSWGHVHLDWMDKQ